MTQDNTLTPPLVLHLMLRVSPSLRWLKVGRKDIIRNFLGLIPKVSDFAGVLVDYLED